MLFFDAAQSSVLANLAVDEALLERAEQEHSSEELLRIWQADRTFIVLGRSSRVDDEVDRRQAASEAVPIYRRASGGATILAGPGCMFYGLVLSLEQRPHLRMLDQAHRFVMSRMVDALRPLAPEIQFDGTCDLVLAGRKVSGNSVRMIRNWMLYHGTILLEMDIEPMERLLKHPPREPAYRGHRSHREFLTNLPVPYASVARAIRLAWNAIDPAPTIPPAQVDNLVSTKYSQESWNFLR